MSLRISLLKSFDAIIGRMMASLLPAPDTREMSSAICSFLVIRPGGIGDAVLLIPMLDALRKAYPGATLTVLAERRNVGVFQLFPHIDRTLCYDTPRELLAAVTGEYDCVIDTEQSHYLSAIISRITRAPVSIGFDTNRRRRLFSHSVSYAHDRYEVGNFFTLLDPLGIHHADEIPLRFLETDNPDLSGELRSVSRPFITLFPGASIRERQWGAERFHHLITMLQPFGIEVVVIGGNAEKRVGEQIVAGGIGLNLTGKTTLKKTAALIDASALLVTADSGMLHLAVGLGKPTVSLFGPGRHKKWAPIGEKHIVLNKKLPCSPCTTFGTTPSCRDDARCMQEITVDEVFNAVTILLTEIGVMKRACCTRDLIEVA